MMWNVPDLTTFSFQSVFWHPFCIAFIYDVTKKTDILIFKLNIFFQFPFQAEDPLLSNMAVIGHGNIILSER